MTPTTPQDCSPHSPRTLGRFDRRFGVIIGRGTQVEFDPASDVVEAKWRRQSTRILHAGRVVLTEHTVELPTGEETTFEVDESIPYAVAVLICPEPGSVILTRQYRYAIDAWIFDLPGGAGNNDEDPLDAARRECREETSLIPDQLVHLHTIHPNPGRSAWPLHLYFATATTRGTADTSDPSEQVATVTTSLEDLDRRIRAGDIIDPALLTARLFAGLHHLLPALTPTP